MTAAGDSRAPFSTVRRPYIDVARGVAVLLMIEAHTLDAWTRAADRSSKSFRNATVLGGFAAPLFLWLAGLAVVLSATRAAQKTGSRAAAVDAVCRRGLEIFILAFLFRLQAFVVSPGGSPIALFRVDILNIMGPGIAVGGLIWGAVDSARGRVLAYAVVALIMAMATPMIRAAAFVDALPVWVQWYIRPAGDYTTFTAFPWAGFVFAGAACGALLATARDGRDERRQQTAIGILGAALIAGGFHAATLPSLYRQTSFWTSSPTWFAIRVGVLMVTLSVIFLADRACEHTAIARRVETVLAKLGQRSLFVYWIHVELVYGYASWLWRRRLPLAATLAFYAAFSGIMYAAVVLRDRYLSADRQLTATSVAPAKSIG